MSQFDAGGGSIAAEESLIVFRDLKMARGLHTPFCSLATWLCRSLLCCTDWDSKPIYRFFSAPNSAKQKGWDNKKTTTRKGSVCFVCHLSTVTNKKKESLFLFHPPRSDPLLERVTFSGQHSPFYIITYNNDHLLSQTLLVWTLPSST